MSTLQHLRRWAFAATALGIAMSAAVAQSPSPDFPAQAVALTPEALKGLNGKRFVGTRVDGTGWTMDFGPDDYFRLAYRRGGTGAGPGGGIFDGTVRLDGTKLCQDMRKALESRCNEVRLQGNELFYQRGSNGEIVVLTAQ